MNKRFVIISTIAIGALYLREEEYLLPETSDDYQVTIYELTLEEMGLTPIGHHLLQKIEE